jgi:hypothetical protein
MAQERPNEVANCFPGSVNYFRCLIHYFLQYIDLKEANRMNEQNTYAEEQNRDSSVSIETKATGWTIEVLGFDSWRGLGIFLFTTASRTVLGPTQPTIQRVPEALSLGVKRPGCEAD